MTIEGVDILGIVVHKLSMDQVVEYCDESIRDRRCVVLGVVNAAKLVNCRSDPELRQSLQSSDIFLADGLPVVWLSRWIGDPLPERVAGIDIMYRLLELANQKQHSIYFLGAKGDVVQKVVDYTVANYPQARIAGYRDGYFSGEQEEEVANQIQAAKPDILFVAITSPKKENFQRRFGEMMHVPVCHGVGGSFDIVAGVTKRAPMWMQNWALEWLYRVIQEPRRMWRRYLTTNTQFIGLCFLEVFRHRLKLTSWSRKQKSAGA